MKSFGDEVKTPISDSGRTRQKTFSPIPDQDRLFLEGFYDVDGATTDHEREKRTSQLERALRDIGRRNSIKPNNRAEIQKLPGNPNEKTEIINLPYRPNDNIGFSDIIQYAKKEKPNYTPNPNKRKGSERRRPSGERERNVGHPDGEEHSRVAKGTGGRGNMRRSSSEEIGSAIIGGIATAGGAYLIYRGARMLPSLLPPLWWTIPGNLTIP